MDWNLDWDRLGETAEVEFVGKVIDVRYPCKCPKCEAGKEKLKEMGRNRSTQQLHLVVAPLDRNWRLQHVFIDMTTTSKKSRKGVLAHACKKLGIDVKTFESFKKNLTKQVFLFRKMTVKDYLLNIANIEVTNREEEQLNLDAQITVPIQIIPGGTFELYGITKEIVKDKVERFKKVWKLILKGMSDDQAYQEVFGEEMEQLEKEMEEAEEEEETEKEEETEETEEEEEEKEEEEEEEEEEEYL